MKLNKLLSMGLLGLVLAPAIVSAKTSQTQVTFTGKIVANTCSIKASNTNVNMDPISLEQIKETVPGQKVGQMKEFNVIISDCNATDKPVISYSGDLTNSVESENAAKGISLALYDANGVMTENTGIELTIDGASNAPQNYTMQAGFINSTTQDIVATAGEFKTTATFTLSYQ